MTATVWTSEQYSAAREEFNALCHEKGVAEAVSQWCGKPFAAWLDSLTKGEDITTMEDRARLTVAMSVSLDVRDALIISMLDDPQAHQLDTLQLIAAQTAHEPEAGKLVWRLLFDGFGDTRQPDRKRIETMLDILMRMGEDIAETGASPFLLAQPCAALAYLYWWTGNEVNARAAITLTLDANPACALAETILALIDADIWPVASTPADK